MLRTQTSPVQVREMEKGKLPIRMIAPGRVFRSDEVDATHSPSFHQIEEMCIRDRVKPANPGTDFRGCKVRGSAAAGREGDR